jgi:hypothetical protein
MQFTFWGYEAVLHTPKIELWLPLTRRAGLFGLILLFSAVALFRVAFGI